MSLKKLAKARWTDITSYCRIIGIAILVSITTSFLSGCDTSLGSLFDAKSPYPIKSSGLVFGLRFGPDPIYWLDNDRALFPAYAIERRKDKDGKDSIQGTPPGIYIWDTKNNTYTRHDKLQNGPWFLCFNKNFLAYSIDGDMQGDQKIVKAGRFGQEQQLPKEIFWKLHPELKQCDEPKAEVRPEHLDSFEHHDAGINFLRLEDGYLFVGTAKEHGGRIINPDNQNTPVQFYQRGRTDPIALPILPKETFQVESFSEYAGKYLIIPSRPKARDLSDNNTGWADKVPKPVYLLSPSGSVETVEIPWGPWVNMNKAYLTAKGILIVSNYATGANSKNAGGYLFHDGKVTKLFDQLVDGAGVSPDGCKIAFANNDFNPKTTEYVQVIDLCKQ